jgi:hypothetical protein
MLAENLGLAVVDLALPTVQLMLDNHLRWAYSKQAMPTR